VEFPRWSALRMQGAFARAQSGTESFFKKIVDRKTGTDIYDAPQRREPSETVFVESTMREEIRKKLLTMTKTRIGCPSR